ncbi:MAG TPA: acyl-CoA dehydrogenase family protein [Candidatus Binatia bacterium]|nr:acyl-CoA dehydrogenase family protein [Candidatus Binatia bacterium]
MDFGFSEDQEMLRQSARDFLAKECPMTLVRKMMDDESGHSRELWKKMAELGWHGLILPEEYGGAGLTFVDLVVVLEEMGRVVLPGPFLSTVVYAGVTLLEAGSDEQKKKLLPKIATGELVATLALLEPSGRWDADGIAATATAEGGGYRLDGTKLFVPDGHVADLLIVAARKPGTSGKDGVSLFVVEANAAGVKRTPLKTMDQTRKLSEVTLSAVKVGKDALLGAEGRAWKTIERVADRGKVALCAEMCGGAQRVLDMSVEYAKVREQFGKPIGSFQAIQHKCANMMVQVESSKSATYYAAWAVANDVEEAPLAAAMAKAYCSDAYRMVAGEGIQIHGGIGFTWEHDMHIYFKRAKSSEVTFGDATWNREIVAQHIL